MKQVAVIDPGLMEAGGHHAALLETLIHSENAETNISVFTHQELDNDLETKAKSSGVQVHRFFSSNFYQHYEDSLDLSLSGMQYYIRLLAREYALAIQFASKHSEQGGVVCFYPCLNWEHASAVSLALELISKTGGIGITHNLTHKVCCMFTPIKRLFNSELYYRMAFSRLSTQKGVSLFASDKETQDYYQLLEVPIKGIHPCYLLPWQRLNVSEEKINNVPNLLLYMGDAKENKGFLRLPNLVKQLLVLYDYKVSLTVQYTLSWEYPALADAIAQLNELAKEYEQLQLITQFWSTAEILRCMNETDLVLCSYDTQAYQHKSSGLAWLACHFNVPVILRGECWLSRELERLGAPCETNPSLTEQYSPKAVQGDRFYRESLYADLLPWLTR